MFFQKIFWNWKHLTYQFKQGRNCFKNESTWRCEIKEQTPQVTLLYRGRTVRISHMRYCIRKLFLNLLQYPQENLCWSLFLKKLQTFRLATLFKKRRRHRCFLVNIAKLLILPILKSICKQLLFNFFNGSLLHGPKGLRSRFHEGARLQGPSHSSSFCF